MKKVFYVSLPFDEENSGDYDYCQVSVNSLIAPDINAEYIIGNRVEGYDTQRANSLLNTIKAKNKGGHDFYNSLQSFYNHPVRKELADLVKKYLISDKAEYKILNLQIRAPETGFLFSDVDLIDLKAKGFKICVTCHEYKLNYGRKWLQSVLHNYFIQADLVFFFNLKDLKNASKHADYSAFLDKCPVPIEIDRQEISHKLLTKPFDYSVKSSQGEIHYFNAMFNDKVIKQNLECDLFNGKLITALSKESGVFNSGVGNFSISAGNKLKLTGTYQHLKVPSSEIRLTGIALSIALKANQVETVAKLCGDSYEFLHEPYDLASKSKLTRVPPTVHLGSPIPFESKPPNIIIFGMIREGKGFEDALQIATEIAYNPDFKGKMRILIIGNPLSYELLAQIINRKFGCDSPNQAHVNKELLLKIVNNSVLGQEAVQLIEKVKNEKIGQFKHLTSSQFMVPDELIAGFYANILTEQQKIKTQVKLSDPSYIQQFIGLMERNITEALPIDIFLNVNREELQYIFAQAKYAVKYDEKGWANNASGLINMLAYGCILYTGWGMCTDSEVTEKRYKGAIILPAGKYCLKPGMHLEFDEEASGKGKYFSSKKDSKHDSKKNLITPKDILNDISIREGWIKAKVASKVKAEVKKELEDKEDVKEQHITEFREEVLISNRNNKQTFELAQSLLKTEFATKKIAQEMTISFLELFDAHKFDALQIISMGHDSIMEAGLNDVYYD